MNSEYLFSAPSMQKGIINKDYLNKYLDVDTRRSDASINYLVARNKYILDFLGVKLALQISDHDSGRGLEYETSRYIGAVPTFLPNGLQGGDICIYPNLGFPKNYAFEELSLIFNMLGENIKIEFAKSESLRNNMDLRPPMFLEAVKYIDLYEVAIKENWRKFSTEIRTHSYAKASTDWQLYAKRYYDPNKRLEFISRDSVLTTDHKEWRALKYVYELACDEIEAPTTPKKTKNRYLLKTQIINNQVKNVKAEKTEQINCHVNDPNAIKELKQQANRFINGFTDKCPGWRIDIAEVYERYVQFLLRKVAYILGGEEVSNYKIIGTGQIPAWGLKYLEPDAVIHFNSNESRNECLLIADAKYKSNMYNLSSSTEVLKDTHRHDLHQVLGYCSFAPQTNKVVMIIYPSNEFKIQEIFYNSKISEVTNTVILVGVVFKAEKSDEMIDELSKVVKKIITLS